MNAKHKYNVFVLATLVLLLPMLLWHYVPSPVCLALVTGDSMLPTMPSGSIAIGLSKYLVTPEVGDVAIVKQGDNYVIHRIIYLDSEKVITKGDNNALEDQTQPIQNIAYIVVAFIPPRYANFFLATIYLYITVVVIYHVKKLCEHLSTPPSSKKSGNNHVGATVTD